MNSSERTPKALPSISDSSQTTLATVGSVLLEVGLVAAFFSSLTFIAGWSYADRFFSELGISLSGLGGLGTESMTAYAFWVFRDGWFGITVFAGAAVAFLFAVATVHSLGLMRMDKPFGKAFIVILLATFAGLAFAGASYLGRSRASSQAVSLFENEYRSFRRIKVIPKSGTALEAYFSENGNLGESTCLRKIYMDKKNLYAYRGLSRPSGIPDIITIPLSEVGVLEILQLQDLCVG